jgi:hypothetical protein
VTLAYDIGFLAKELRDIRRLVSEHAADPSLRSRTGFLKIWNDNFGA